MRSGFKQRMGLNNLNIASSTDCCVMRADCVILWMCPSDLVAWLPEQGGPQRSGALWIHELWSKLLIQSLVDP